MRFERLDGRRPHRMARVVWLVAIGLLLSLPAISVAMQAEDAVSEKYESVWTPRERDARTPEARGKLAEDLLEAAKSSNTDPAMAAHLARRCHDWAARDRANFHIAAKGLEYLAELDDAFRAEALEKLRELYNRAYSENRQTKLGYGITMAEVSLRLARQMLTDFEHQRYTRDMTAEQMLVELRKISNEYRLAERTARSVLASARGLARRYERIDANQSQRLLQFVEQKQPLLEQAQKESQAPAALSNDLLALLGQQRRFQTTQDRQAAEKAGQIYLISLDSPEDALPYAKHYMDKKDRQMVLLATKPMSELRPEDASALGDWYAALADEAASHARPAMLLRAYDYLALAKASLPADQAGKVEAALARVESTMQQIDLTPPTQVAAAEPIAPRPQPQSPPEPATQPQPPAEPQPTAPPKPQPPSRPSTPTDPQPATKPAAGNMEPAPRPTRRRRTHICPQCQREFMVMPGQHREICEWCEEGKDNIFDFN